MARLTGFTKRKQEIIEKLAYRGFTEEEMGEILHVTRATLYNWKKKRPELFDAIKKSKDHADEIVKGCLYDRAVGMKYEEVVEEYRKGVLVSTKKSYKALAPDVTAQIFWLKNRQSKDWRDKQEVDMNSNVTIVNRIPEPEGET